MSWKLKLNDTSFESFYLDLLNYVHCMYILRGRDQAILQLLGTDFPGGIGSKKYENFKSHTFSIIFDSMVSGYSGINNSNI